MTKAYTCFLTAFCLLIPFTASAQGSPCGSAPADSEQIGEPLPPGAFVAGELILRLEHPMIDASARTKFEISVEKGGGKILEYSPSFSYVRVGGVEFDECEILSGDGKPLGNNDGQGQNWSLNYVAGSLGWVSEETLPCGDPVLSPTQNEGVDLVGYTPVNGCQDPENFVPPTGTSVVKVAIIDSGVRSARTQGRINGVRHRQTIIPADCGQGDCTPITSGIRHYSRGFARHGKQIADLLSGWFWSRGMQDQLDMHSYQVLDENLQCNVFQVVKAIELATNDYGANLINLSIGFTPLDCSETGASQIVPENNILRQAIRDAEEKGVIVIAAAGNSCKDLKVSPEFPAAEQGLNNLVVVGALACGDKERAPWSNYGEGYVDLFAPGSRVKIPGFGCDEEVYGTSFATPIVTAKAAFHITNQEEYDYQEVLCLLRSQAEPFEEATYGYVHKDAGKGQCERKAAPATGGAQATSVLTKTARVTIAPNPFHETFTLRLPEELSGAPGTVTLLDANGRRVENRELTGDLQQLELAHLRPGLYWVRVATERGNSVTRVFKR